MQRRGGTMRKGWLSWLGYCVLIAALPLAMLGAVSEANEYRAMGVDALDCDGPLGVLLFSVPAILIYAAGGILNARRFRRRRSAMVACLCGLICVPLTVNIGAALRESNRPDVRDGCRSATAQSVAPSVSRLRRYPVAST
ncbi:hypothetical protein [uncultured Bosea sp.]|uniref:hypothetical protein n=1 Tax=uncultured Bosea sp. TaxID=211457 RepID=UPI002600937E|nr:hypothetical protein [uncultured Bosea sp.]